MLRQDDSSFSKVCGVLGIPVVLSEELTDNQGNSALFDISAEFYSDVHV